MLALCQSGYYQDAWKNPKERELKDSIPDPATERMFAGMHGKIPRNGN